ncbi:uncharacterized protein C2845_PM12G16830 [Panicum miliaceum]|uniref:Uncharacterized protein n=1 Tax=Panicum miliaceum TaxID=4540 RepID=A0A3L6QD42_PANMI|nr:uncharacterized protein C2845_PM12G16830 [Panicum miliaceum]
MAEKQFKRDLKARYLGMSAIEKLKLRQRSRLCMIKATKASEKLFFLRVTGRRCKNFIQHLQVEGRTVHTHKEKAECIFRHFSSYFADQQSREHTINWEEIGTQRDNLQALELPFTEQEVWSVVQDLAAEKASRPDGYIALFINPVRDEVKEVAEILQAFGNVSGLRVNQLKSAVYPIRCEGINNEETMQWFQCPIKAFPCSYLGLPLHFRKLQKVEVQPLIEKMAASVSPNCVQPAKIDKIRRGFLWKGEAYADGGHCLVNWRKAKMPKKFGGLGILDLDLFSRALRLRWLWLEWVDSDHPWVGTVPHITQVDRQLFRISAVVTLGDGRKAKFWHDTWLDGRAPIDIAPSLYKWAWRKHIKVQEELCNQCWTRGLQRMTSVTEMAEFVCLWDLVTQATLGEGQDAIAWKWTANGEY